MANRLTLRMMLIALSAAAVGAGFQARAADAPAVMTKTVRRGGSWTIPGLREIKDQPPSTQRQFILDGVMVDEADHRPIDIPGATGRGEVVAIVLQAPDHQLLWEEELVADSVRIFSVAGHVFCVDVAVHPYDYDEASGIGGAVGARFDIAFYDEQGKGKFQTLEPSGYLLGGPAWKPHVPDWTKKKRP